MKGHINGKLAFMIAGLLLTAACATTPPPRVSTPPAGKPVTQPTIQPPVIAGISGPRESAPASEVQLTCIARDINGLALSYSWSVDKGTIKDEGKPMGSAVIWITPDTTGNYTATVKVTNSRGGEASFSKSFGVVTNPFGNNTTDSTIYLELNMSSASPVTASGAATAGEISEIQCVVRGQDLATLTFKWSAPIGKLMGSGIEEGQANRVGWLAPGVPGQYTVNVTVSDKSGHVAKGQVAFDVAELRP
jgi:hypothetical protein